MNYLFLKLLLKENHYFVDKSFLNLIRMQQTGRYALCYNVLQRDIDD
jgi:hypothetical protein